MKLGLKPNINPCAMRQSHLKFRSNWLNNKDRTKLKISQLFYDKKQGFCHPDLLRIHSHQVNVYMDTVR